jgi:alcohol dehydrogenase class IV
MSSGYAEKLFHEFDSKGISYEIITVSGEPSPDLIDQAVRTLSEKDFNLVVGIGGGSVLDAGKAISAMIYRSGSVTEFLEGVGTKDHPGTKLPFIAVPTTSGTGTEATKNAVISEIGREGFKKSLRHDNFVPDVALIDPNLTLNCPRDITAASGMDCFTQLTEAYLSDKGSEYTDALALEGIKAVKKSLVRCFSDGTDLEARTGMSFAALTSGICIANAGLGAVHGFASSIGGMFDIPHGLVCGTLMAAANEVNIKFLRRNSSNQTALKKYAVLGKLFLGDESRSDDYFIDGFAGQLHKMTHDLKLSRLSKYGIKPTDIEDICKKTEIKNNPAKLVQEDLTEILLMRL